MCVNSLEETMKRNDIIISLRCNIQILAGIQNRVGRVRSML